MEPSELWTLPLINIQQVNVLHVHFSLTRKDNIVAADDLGMQLLWNLSKLLYNWIWMISSYHQISNIECTLIGNKIVDHWDVVGALPVGAAPITSSFST